MRQCSLHFGILGFTLFLLGSHLGPASAQTVQSRVDEALQNITSLIRPGKVGYATVWDGNKYVQCRRTATRDLRCEAAGFSMQPSLQRVLTPERLQRLSEQGWQLDSSFGNYVRIFSADVATDSAAGQILKTLVDGYGANPADIEIHSIWIDDTPCPPRNGFSQNLAGMVNDAKEMRATAVRDCVYKSNVEPQQQAATSANDLIARYGATTTAEIQRLKVNAARRVFTVFGAGIGYVQCMPETPPEAIYCEAQSAESWPALSALLTPERVTRLHSAGYADPGRAPNYSKSYPFKQYSNAAIAAELLTILHEVYGYTGAVKLSIKTEKD
jgi:hypothetical protein